jgi:uncharacterized SAM-binding protein YcdF (DUF218 family)
MRQVARRTLIVLAVAGAVAAGWTLFEGGRYLQHEDPIRKADAIYVLGGTRFERPLEAVDLFKAGDASVILLSPGQEEAAVAILRARGVDVPHDTDAVVEAMVGLGVPRSAVLVGGGSVDNTAEEGAQLKAEAARHGWRTVIVVTSKYHTRRAGFAMRRALDGTGVAVVMRATRYDPADPARWWRHRHDIRLLLEEWPKVIAYRLGLSA